MIKEVMRKPDPKWITMTMALSDQRIEFNKDVVELMFAPVVYIIFGKAVVLYVGMSKKGLGRVFDRKHHVLTPDVWAEVESIQVLRVQSEAAARALETRLIQEFNPKYNDRQCICPAKHGQLRVTATIDRLSA